MDSIEAFHRQALQQANTRLKAQRDKLLKALIEEHTCYAAEALSPTHYRQVVSRDFSFRNCDVCATIAEALEVA